MFFFGSSCLLNHVESLENKLPMIFHTPGPCSMANAQFIYDTLWPSMVGNPAFACFCMESCCFPKQSIDSVDAAITHATSSRGLIRQVLLKVTPLTGPQYMVWGNQTITVFENTLSTLKWGWVKTCYYHI